MAGPDQPHVFAAKIYKVGIIRSLDVPAPVSKALGGAPLIPVRGFIEGLPMRTTLVPRGNGRHRLCIHSDIYRKLRMDAGAIVEVTLEIDEDSREPAIPPALAVALKYAPRAARAFRGMTTALRRQIVRYLASAKQASTIERRVATFVRRLERRKTAAVKRRPKPAPAA
jgi:hypothetical protein